MFAAIGIVILLVMVFGGFALTGGALGPVMEAVPHEMLIIGGAAIGALVAGNSMDGLKAIGRSMKVIFKGPQHTKQDHIDAIALTAQCMKLLKNEGPVALESHVENPQDSTIFSAYPNLLKNEPLIGLICDTLTLLVVSSGTLETHAVEEVMDNAMKTHFHELHEPQHTLQSLADALPALGIVAAVLGVVKTMGSIDKPPEILGGMIGSALVGSPGLRHRGSARGTPEAGAGAGRTDFPRGEAGDHRLALWPSAAAGGGKRPLGSGPYGPAGADRTARRAAGPVRWPAPRRVATTRSPLSSRR